MYDFFTTESRSQSFFVQPSFHLRISHSFFVALFERSHGQGDLYKGPGQHFYHYLESLSALGGGDKFLDAIEQLMARQALLAQGLLYHHAFLCVALFSILRSKSSISFHSPYILTECTKQLALAVECPDSRVKFWLWETFSCGARRTLTEVCKVPFTEQTYETVQQHLLSASKAIHDKVSFTLVVTYLISDNSCVVS